MSLLLGKIPAPNLKGCAVNTSQSSTDIAHFPVSANERVCQRETHAHMYTHMYTHRKKAPREVRLQDPNAELLGRPSISQKLAVS